MCECIDMYVTMRYAVFIICTYLFSCSSTSKSDDQVPDEVRLYIDDDSRRQDDNNNDEDDNISNHNINNTNVFASHLLEQSSSHEMELHRTAYSDIGLDQESSGTPLVHRVSYGSSDTVWSAETVYLDAVSEKAATKTDTMSTSSHDLKGEDGLTTDDEFY